MKKCALLLPLLGIFFVGCDSKKDVDPEASHPSDMHWGTSPATEDNPMSDEQPEAHWGTSPSN